MGNRFLLCFVLYCLLFTGLLFRSKEILSFMMPFFVYLGIGIIYKPEHVRLRISRHMSIDRAVEGSSILIRLKVKNEGERLEEVTIRDLFPQALEAEEGPASLIASMEPQEVLEWDYTVKPNRGDFKFDGVRFYAGDHTCLFSRQEVLPVEDRLIILPKYMKLKPLPIRPKRTRGYSGFIPSRTGGQGVEFFGVREYQNGDSPRLINWKATARHLRSFFTNEFELERVADVGVILDARWRSYVRWKEEILFERAVSAAAALSDVFLGQGNRVGMFIYGRVLDWTFPGYGNMQKERILQALARARISKDSVFDNLAYLPTRLFPSHSQIIIISPLVKDDVKTLLQMRARGYQVTVISPDPISFEEENLQSSPDHEMAYRIASIERNLMLREFRRFGVRIINWPVGIPLHNLGLGRFHHERRFTTETQRSQRTD